MRTAEPKPVIKTFTPRPRQKHGVWARLKLPASHGKRLRSAIMDGFEVNTVEMAQQELNSSQGVILEIAGLSPRTLARRKVEGRLTAEESDRIARLATVISAAEGLFEDDHDAAVSWLNSPVKALGQEVPVELLKTEAGTRDILDLIERLEHGVFC